MAPSMIDAIQRLTGERSRAFRDLEAALDISISALQWGPEVTSI